MLSEVSRDVFGTYRTFFEPQNLFGVRPIHIAAKMGNLNIVKFFMEQTIGTIDKEPKDNRNGWRPIHYAVYTGINLEVVKYLMSVIKEKEPRDLEGRTPLDLARNEWRDVTDDCTQEDFDDYFQWCKIEEVVFFLEAFFNDTTLQ